MTLIHDTYEDILTHLCAHYGWEYDSPETLICPCGDTIEHDGSCPDCGPSPLLREGLI